MDALNRRSFLKGAGVVSGAALLTGMMGCSSSGSKTEAVAEWEPEKWDREVDVVVLGTGSIVPAACKAHDLGLEVLILEKHPTYFGGTSSFSGGWWTCPNSTKAKEAGVEEIDRDTLKSYLEYCAQGASEDEIIEALLDNYVPATDYMIDELGVDAYVNPDKPQGAYYDHHHEIEEKYPMVSSSMQPNGHPNGTNLGRAFRDYLRDAVDERGIEILFGTAGKKLIYSGNPALENGEVVGIYAETTDGETLAIKARYGVIIGTGGFDHNRDMVAQYLPAPVMSTIAIETNTGDGHLMAMELGADLRNMNEAFRMTMIMTEGTDVYAGSDLSRDDNTYSSEAVSMITGSSAIGRPHSLIVNKYGNRVGDESSSYDLFERSFEWFDTGRYEWGNIPLVWIGDREHFERYSLPTLRALGNRDAELPDELPAFIERFETIDELASGMGIDVDNLKYTIERFNKFADDGVDRDWNRGESIYDKYSSGDLDRLEAGELKNACLGKVGTAPFFAIRLYPGILQTKGGLRINKNAQVVNVNGNPIPRLYAASCTVANPLGRGYGWGGGTIACGVVFGQIAAEHVSTLSAWDAADSE